MVPPHSVRIPRVHTYSGYPCSAGSFTYRTVTFSGWPSHAIQLDFAVTYRVHTPNVLLPSVWPLPISLAATFRISFDFSSYAYLDVSLRRVPLVKLCIHLTIHGYSPWGFPHSDTHGSRLIYSSPWLFAVSRVLHRLLMPRHSPYALFRLNFVSHIQRIFASPLYCIFKNRK